MGFMDSVGKFGEKIYTSASKTAGTISDKSKELAEKTKLKKQISTEQSLIAKKYNDIGGKYYELNKNTPPEGFAEDFRVINNSLAKIETLKLELEELEADNICPSCGVKLKRDQIFCHLCGAKTNFDNTSTETDSSSNADTVIEVSAEDIEVKD